MTVMLKGVWILWEISRGGEPLRRSLPQTPHELAPRDENIDSLIAWHNEHYHRLEKKP